MNNHQMIINNPRGKTKKKGFLRKAGKIALGAGVIAGTAYGGKKGLSYLQNRKAGGGKSNFKPNNSKPNNSKPNNSGQSPANNPIDKRARNRELVRKRKELLGAKAQAFDMSGRTPQEVESFKRMKKKLGKANAAKARKLRSQNAYLARNLKHIISFSQKTNKGRRETREDKAYKKRFLRTAGGAAGLSFLALGNDIRDIRRGIDRPFLKNPSTYALLGAGGLSLKAHSIQDKHRRKKRERNQRRFGRFGRFGR